MYMVQSIAISLDPSPRGTQRVHRIVCHRLKGFSQRLAERGGRNGKKRAIVATARKLAVLLHHLWLSGEVYEPLHNSGRVAVAAAA